MPDGLTLKKATFAAERESLEDIAFNMARRYGARAGFSEEATRAFVANKLKEIPSHFDGETSAERAYLKAKWVQDNCCVALLNESGW
jgi:hypothetical protein